MDTRPIAERRRTWETVERVALPSGDYAYSAKLYDTHVATYYPDGLVEVRCGGWPTPTTAEFIAWWTPFDGCFKRAKKLWVDLHGVKVPVPDEGPLQIRHDGTRWNAVNAETIKQKAIDRTKMREARDKVRPFLDWAKTFLKMSDGWVMNETREQFATKIEKGWHVNFDFGVRTGVANVLRDAPVNKWEAARLGNNPEALRERYDYEGTLAMLASDDPTVRFRVLFTILNSLDPTMKRLVRSAEETITWANGGSYDVEVKWYDFQYNYEQVSRRIDKILKANEDVHTIVEHKPSSCVRSNIVV